MWELFRIREPISSFFRAHFSPYLSTLHCLQLHQSLLTFSFSHFWHFVFNFSILDHATFHRFFLFSQFVSIENFGKFGTIILTPHLRNFALLWLSCQNLFWFARNCKEFSSSFIFLHVNLSCNRNIKVYLNIFLLTGRNEPDLNKLAK